MERANIRHSKKSDFDHEIDGAVIDVSFISLRQIVPCVSPLLARGADVGALVKPQFEAGRREVGRKGVIRDPRVQERVDAGKVAMKQQRWSAAEKAFAEALEVDPLNDEAQKLLKAHNVPYRNTFQNSYMWEMLSGILPVIVVLGLARPSRIWMGLMYAFTGQAVARFVFRTSSKGIPSHITGPSPHWLPTEVLSAFQTAP
jgi:hypothetical protein